MDSSQSCSCLNDTDCIPERDTEQDFTEWFEDATSDADWFQSISITTESAKCSLGEESSFMKELFEKNKIIEEKWTEADHKYQNLKIENEKLTAQLINERHRANKYHKKLQYIQENYHIFNRLKQAYLNMKYNQSADKTEIKDEACQTWQGILCEACIETAELRKQLANYPPTNTPDTVIVNRADLNKMQETVIQLKQMIDNREKSWSYNIERENGYKADIKQLKNNIIHLNDIIAEKYNEIETIKSKDNNADTIQKENGFLRKIVVKLEQRLREVDKVCRPEKRLPLLNPQEKDVVQQLIKKYAHKLELKKKRCSAFDSTSLESSQSMEASLQHASLTDIIEANACCSGLNGGGEGCPGIVSIPNIQLHVNPTGDYKEQAEKPLTN